MQTIANRQAKVKRQAPAGSAGRKPRAEAAEMKRRQQQQQTNGHPKRDGRCFEAVLLQLVMLGYMKP